jgi:hypothetical protein
MNWLSSCTHFTPKKNSPVQHYQLAVWRQEVVHKYCKHMYDSVHLSSYNIVAYNLYIDLNW